MNNLYDIRYRALKKFLELNAPQSIIYFSTLNLLKTKYNNSSYKLAWVIFKGQVIFDTIYQLDCIKIIYYRYIRRMTVEQALDKVFPE